MVPTRRTVDIETAISAAIGALLDEREARLVTAWARSWDTVTGELEAAVADLVQAADGDTVSPSAIIRSARLQAALDALADALVEVAGEAAEGIADDLRASARTGEIGTIAMISDQLPDSEDLARVGVSVIAADPGQITAMLERTIQNVTRDMADMPIEQAAIIRAELNRGITVGANPRETARRIVTRMEGRFNYGLTRALVVSRTETLDAHRAAGKATELANRDVLTQWRWSAHIDARTCRACIAMHGTLHDLDEDGPNDHHQGRCARVPVTKSWADLGFPDLDEPEPLRDTGANEFAALPVEDQKAILGRDWDAWQAGEYPIDQWVKVRGNDGWRDSIAPTTA